MASLMQTGPLVLMTRNPRLVNVCSLVKHLFLGHQGSKRWYQDQALSQNIEP